MKFSKNDARFWILDSILTIGSIVIIVLLIQKYLFAPFVVHGPSMCNTINFTEGVCQPAEYERVMINAFSYHFNDPQKGDIIIFDNKENSLIKRVIATGGDQIQIKDNYVFLKAAGEETFQKIDEYYLNEENKGKTQQKFMEGIIKVPEDRYLVMGDNRKVSNDSRSCFQNVSPSDCTEQSGEMFIEKSQIRGKAWFVFWPFSSWRGL